MAKMLITGPICSIRAGGGAGSRQISPFLTSESDSTGRKPWNMFHGITYCKNLDFCRLFEPSYAHKLALHSCIKIPLGMVIIM